MGASCARGDFTYWSSGHQAEWRANKDWKLTLLHPHLSTARVLGIAGATTTMDGSCPRWLTTTVLYRVFYRYFIVDCIEQTLYQVVLC